MEHITATLDSFVLNEEEAEETEEDVVELERESDTTLTE